MSNPFQELFDAQKANQYALANTTAKERIKKLEALKKAIMVTYKEDIYKALEADLNKPRVETDLTELFPVISEIKFAIKYMRTWVSNNYVKTPMSLLGASSWIKYEPKGVSLIIAPWNFPFHLALCPLVSAIAAGNTVVLKPSEMSPNVTDIIEKIIKDLFNENEIALVQGAVQESTDLLKLPFNHVYFTGSPQVGKIVMAAAAKHLASVTLELGGKSPTIVDSSASLKTAAKKIVWGRFANAGQTCLAPDYVLVEQKVEKEFIGALKNAITDFFTEHPMQSEHYCKLIHEGHFDRMKGMLDDAVKSGATVEIGGNSDKDILRLEPTVLSNVTLVSRVMQEEIFGPLLPIVTFNTLEEAIEIIQSKEKPLGLYIYSSKNKNIKYLLDNTRAGSTCVNNNLIQYSNHYLPFGGSNNSGIGKVHGFYGFQEFSNARSVMKQHTFGAIQLLFPPYNNFKKRLTEFTVKWF
ncbi:aldehyde dehydrogenase family protein [Urechidicola vernalis]|uniref:Aldehyde dehydrogenase n=1 Tax=Urechidicola vernalis TaxID=3075600 RepID=A0ABU2Y5A5_9FLAO|nr:aldehyde dehydrogenase family protein [Urechidicola sp. P050]MDT0552971.1 aldehyde dehydrogenase family protein [Urechidicola sp. P050]